MSLILFQTWIVVNDINFGSTKVIRRHKVLTHGQERLFRKVTSVSIPSFVEWLDTFSYKEKKINKRVPLLLTYHPSLEKISGIVRHHWKEMEKSETLTKLFPKPPVVAFRRPKSIKDTLVRAAVCRPSSTVGSVNHVVTSVASAVSNCNTHKCSIARRKGRSIRSFAMSIAKHLMWFTSLTVRSAGRNT